MTPQQCTIIFLAAAALLISFWLGVGTADQENGFIFVLGMVFVCLCSVVATTSLFRLIYLQF